MVVAVYVAVPGVSKNVVTVPGLALSKLVT